jgi:predicted HicB family RNase H-like nuclease
MSKANLNYKGYTGSCEVSFDDNCLHGKILFIQDLITYEAESPAALEESFKAAVDRYLAYCKKTGKSADKPYSGSFNVRPGPEIHRSAAQRAHEMGIGLNDFVTKAMQCLLDQEIVTKVEHYHSHVVTVQMPLQETRMASSASPMSWEPVHATTH